MSTNLRNVAYLRSSRSFPIDNEELSVELEKAYIDTALAVNSRILGLYGTQDQLINGEQWFLTNTKSQQGLRQVYLFDDSTLTQDHNINFNNLTNFVKIYGCFYDGTNWYPLPYVDVANANNQVNIYVSPTQIVVTKGGGTPPTITSGTIVLEWLAK